MRREGRITKCWYVTSWDENSLQCIIIRYECPDNTLKVWSSYKALAIIICRAYGAFFLRPASQTRRTSSWCNQPRERVWKGEKVTTEEDKKRGNKRRDVRGSLFHLPLQSNCHISLVWIVFYFLLCPSLFSASLPPSLSLAVARCLFFPLSLSPLPRKETLQK